MDPSAVCILLLLGLPAASSKYVLVKQPKDWYEAQAYCREKHTDLAPISSEHDMELLESLDGGSCSSIYAWIGLWRKQGSKSWFWSGGTEVSTTFWANNQPNYLSSETVVTMDRCMWHDAPPSGSKYFYCFDVVLQREEKTWEEALDHCREQGGDLASVASQTETMLIRRKLLGSGAVGRVWIGLRFLATEWMWVDGQPLDYQAWAGGTQPRCPGGRRRCAALQVTEPPGGTGDGAWIPHDCTEKLPFICY